MKKYQNLIKLKYLMYKSNTQNYCLYIYKQKYSVYDWTKTISGTPVNEIEREKEREAKI